MVLWYSPIDIILRIIAFRQNCLAAMLTQAHKLPEWKQTYSTRCPHQALDYLTPLKFLEQWKDYKRKKVMDQIKVEVLRPIGEKAVKFQEEQLIAPGLSSAEKRRSQEFGKCWVIVSSRSCKLNGLVIYPSAPISWASFTLSSCARAVSMTIGIVLVTGSVLIV